MTVSSISNSHPSLLPARFKKKLYNEKIKTIVLAVFTCGISLGIRAFVREIKVQQLNKLLLPAAFIDPASTPPIVDPNSKIAPIINQDGLKLDAREIEVNSSSKKWLVYFCGNGMLYQDSYDELSEFAKKINVNLLVFNYRGVGFSEGKPIGLNHLLIDGAACVEYLKQKKNVKEKDIVLWGFSLGGAVAAILSTYYDNIKVFSERSFSSSLKAIYYLCGKGIFGVFGIVIVTLTGSKITVGRYWKKISPKRKLLAYHPLDGVIQKPASLYKAEKKRIIKKHPGYLLKVGNKLKLPAHRKPLCVKINAGRNVLHRSNHNAMDAKNAREIVRSLKLLLRR